MKSEKPQPPSPKVKITLAAPHTHGGERRAAGAVIEVTARQRDRLAQRGLVQGAPAPTAQEE